MHRIEASSQFSLAWTTWLGEVFISFIYLLLNLDVTELETNLQMIWKITLLNASILDTGAGK